MNLSFGLRTNVIGSPQEHNAIIIKDRPNVNFQIQRFLISLGRLDIF